MTIEEMRKAGADELQARLAEIAKTEFEARCTSQRLAPQKGMELRLLRRERARVLTVLRARELAASLPAEVQRTGEVLAGLNARSADVTVRRRAARLRDAKQRMERVLRQVGKGN